VSGAAQDVSIQKATTSFVFMEPPVAKLFGAAGGVIEEDGKHSDKSAKSCDKTPVQAGILESWSMNKLQFRLA